MVIRVERCGARELGQRAWAGNEGAEERQVTIDAKILCMVRAGDGELCLQLSNVETFAVLMRDQSQRWRVETVRGKECRALRENVQVRAHDTSQGLEIELVERQPLAEDAIVGQSLAYALEML